jgi:hypothetical protein
MNDSARQIFSKINDSVSPDSLKNYQYKKYSNVIVTTKGIEKVVEFIKGDK